MKHFNQFFQKDEDQNLRRWPQIPEGKIKDIHKVAAQKTEDLLDQFRTLSLPMAEATPQQALLTEEHLVSVRNKLRTDMELGLEDALLKHVSF
jgi:hypothetical protein